MQYILFALDHRRHDTHAYNIWIYICVCVRKYIQLYIYVCVCINTWTHTDMYTYKNVQYQPDTPPHLDTPPAAGHRHHDKTPITVICVYVCIQMYIYIYMYIIFTDMLHTFAVFAAWYTRLDMNKHLSAQYVWMHIVCVYSILAGPILLLFEGYFWVLIVIYAPGNGWRQLRAKIYQFDVFACTCNHLIFWQNSYVCIHTHSALELATCMHAYIHAYVRIQRMQ
jgi:hypothetical protein